MKKLKGKFKGVETIRKIAKKTAITSMCLLALGNAVNSAIPVAYSAKQTKGSYDTLGSNLALGSPILNTENFSTENWNEWETLCWGVFLSNFVQPLVDDYESAFKADHGGSNGAGFEMLWGGTGNDTANADIIRALCEYAIDKENEVTEQIYVGYTRAEGTTCVPIENKKNEMDITDSDVRPATFRDLWFVAEGDGCGFSRDDYAKKIGGGIKITGDNITSIDVGSFGWFFDEKTFWEEETTYGDYYDDIATFRSVNTPTFYVKRNINGGTHYIEVFDYCDYWDVQIPSIIASSLRNSENANTFSKNFFDAYNASAPLCFDSFGNIVTDYNNRELMVIPGVVNQKLTGEKTINILNSWMMNAYATGYTDMDYVFGLRANLGTRETLLPFNHSEAEISQEMIMNGYPAFGSSNIGNPGLFYYDTDSIMTRAIHKGQDSDLSYSKLVKQLFDTKITNGKTPDNIPLKFEIAGNGFGPIAGVFDLTDDTFNTKSTLSIVKLNAYAASMISNISYIPNGSPQYDTLERERCDRTILTDILMPSGQKVSLFNANHGVVIPVKLLLTDQSTERQNDDSDECAGFFRAFYNWLYQVYQNDSDSSAMITKDTLSTFLLKDNCTFGTFTNEVLTNYVDMFIRDNNSTYGGQQFSGYSKMRNNFNWWTDSIMSWEGKVFWDYGNNETTCPNTTRLVLAYTPSQTMTGVSQLFGPNGADFGQWCPYVYMTYLDFYGVTTSSALSSGITNSSKFDTVLFPPERQGVLIKDIQKELYKYEADFTSSINIEDSVLNMSYLMLEPERGRDYRKKIMSNTITDFIYDNYLRIVYGSNEVTGMTSSNKSGFFSIEPYSDLFITGAFLQKYVSIVVWVMMGSLLVMVIFGILKSKRISWYVVSATILINSLLLVPASGDIVPYVTSMAVSNMFYDKMTFWSVSQGITNSSIEHDAATGEQMFDDMDDNEVAALMEAIQNISSVQTDTSLTIKQDISQKVTQVLGSDTYKNIGQYQSARWVMPLVMQQFSGDKGHLEDYIYKPLANIWSDLSNMYWFFNPEDAVYVNQEHKTLTSGQTRTATRTTLSGDAKDLVVSEDGTTSAFGRKLKIFENMRSSSYFADFVSLGDDLRAIRNADGVVGVSSEHTNYKCYSYTVKSEDEQVHNVNYILDATRYPISRQGVMGNYAEPKYTDANSWKSYIEYALRETKIVAPWTTNYGSPERLDSRGKTYSGQKFGFEFVADSYDRQDRGTVDGSLPYLWSTESPIYYFYAVVKDTFPTSQYSFGQVIHALQGDITSSDSTDEADKTGMFDDQDLVRASFMYGTKTIGAESNYTCINGEYDGNRIKYTGKVRDVLDLECMFHNTIPYLYQMNLVANGFDGKSGILQDRKITNELNYYEGENQSWMYRCNWAIKLMENPNYSEAQKVKDSKGNTYTVLNPMLPEYYPPERPMVFSDAQMEAMGLEEEDLNIVELKCCQVNRETAKSWTLLINYANTPGMTKEVLFKQMATDATLMFNKTFSSSGILDTKYTMYPSSLDLRYLSFDSVAKMIVLNATREPTYIYGDTMLNLISDSDMFTAITLLVTAALCAWIVPFIRAALMILVFFLGFGAILKGIFASNKVKANMALGQVITNLIFMAYTIIYYAVFYFILRWTSATEVISYKDYSVDTDNPIWYFLIIVGASLAYIVIMCKHIIFCIKNRGDMGLAAYSAIGSGIVSRINGALGTVGEKLSGAFGGSSSSTTNNMSSTTSVKGTGAGASNSATDVNVVSNSSSTVNNSTQTGGFGGFGAPPERFNNTSGVPASTSSSDATYSSYTNGAQSINDSTTANWSSGSNTEDRTETTYQDIDSVIDAEKAKEKE